MEDCGLFVFKRLCMCVCTSLGVCVCGGGGQSLWLEEHFITAAVVTIATGESNPQQQRHIIKEVTDQDKGAILISQLWVKYKVLK